MRILSKCEICKKTALIIRHRHYTHIHAGGIKSKAETCGSCYRGIKKLIDEATKQI